MRLYCRCRSRVLSWFRVSKRDNLDRYYLFELFGFAVFLHKIHHDEEVGVLHSHPWNGLSFIFGSYLEEKVGKPKRRVRFFNRIVAPVHHRVELADTKPVWTIFFHGRRYNRWEVVDSTGKILDVEPWRGVGGRTSYAPEGALSGSLHTR